MNENFEGQSETLINLLIKHNNMNEETARTTWYGSKTYREILKRELTYISATRAYGELMMELNNNPDWMTGVYDL